MTSKTRKLARHESHSVHEKKYDIGDTEGLNRKWFSDSSRNPSASTATSDAPAANSAGGNSRPPTFFCSGWWRHVRQTTRRREPVSVPFPIVAK
jgi:hypothetical protein